ncbi:MAG: hypothetical protein ACJZ1S_03555 [Candidatus Neomarinimicrobiota bacterium]
MKSCPNIGGGEIRRRLFIGYFGLILTIAVIVFTIIFDFWKLRGLVFFPALLMGITFFEAWDKTCIINAYYGIKNLGKKNQRERDYNSLNIQRIQSSKIILKGIITAIVTTVITYFV